MSAGDLHKFFDFSTADVIGPVALHWFRSAGFAAPNCAALFCGLRLLPLFGVAYPGCSLLCLCNGLCCLMGNRPQSLPFANGGGAAMGSGSQFAGGQRVGTIMITCNMQGRAQIHITRPKRGSHTSHHNKTGECAFRQVSQSPN